MKIDEERRREWLRALRQFKYGIKVRAKLGVFEPIAIQVTEERTVIDQWSTPVWEDEVWTNLLYTCIKDNAYPPLLLKGFVQTAEVSFFNIRLPPTVPKILVAVDIVCKRLSVPLRAKFGVFIGESNEQR